jgi:hypothetical protein
LHRLLHPFPLVTVSAEKNSSAKSIKVNHQVYASNSRHLSRDHTR